MLAICRWKKNETGGIKGGTWGSQIMEGVIYKTWKPDSWWETVSCPLFSCLGLTTPWARHYFIVTWNHQRSKPLTLFPVPTFLFTTASHFTFLFLANFFQPDHLLPPKKRQQKGSFIVLKKDSAVYKEPLYIPPPVFLSALTQTVSR